MTRTCQHCGAPIDPARYANAKFCPRGTDCGLERAGLMRRQRKLEYHAMQARTCKHCGAPIDCRMRSGTKNCKRGTECHRARRRQWGRKLEYLIRERSRQRQPEYLSSVRKRYAANPEYRARRQERIRHRYATDPEYRSRKKAIRAERKIHRRARKLLICMERQRGLCGICREPLAGDIHLDHVIPRALGGPDTLDNLQAAHAVCNLRKGASLAPGGLRIVNNEGER